MERFLFLDMDGVLADFDQHHEDMLGWRSGRLDTKAGGRDVDWDAVRAVKDFYLNIPPMKDMEKLWEYAKALNPTVLTGIPRSTSVPEAAENKRAWISRHLGDDIPVICCLSSEKWKHCRAGDILVDDWEKYRTLWLKAGGTWITHTSAEETIRLLDSAFSAIVR